MSIPSEPEFQNPNPEKSIHPPAVRRKLPDTRLSLNHKFEVGGCKGYLIIGMFEDNTLGEVFIEVQKSGTQLRGMIRAFTLALSLLLQYGVSIDHIVRKFSWQCFEPNGYTPNPDIPFAASIVDYVMRWIGRRFIAGYSDETHTEKPTEFITSRKTR